MYRVMNIMIKNNNRLYDWCDINAGYANNLYNACLYRQRQLMTSRNKTSDELTSNELEVINEVNNCLPLMKKTRTIPQSGVLSYNFLDELMKLTNNPDYCVKDFPKHAAQHVIKNVCQDIKSFFEAIKAYSKDSSLFTGAPKLPNYKKKHGKSTFTCSNQECVIKLNDKAHYVLKLPKTKEVLSLGKKIPGKLMEVHVSPINGIYQISLVFDDLKETPSLNEKPERVIAIDPGIDNLMAITNNVGLECLLYNGKVLKSINHNYNKKIANILSGYTLSNKNKFIPTKRYQTITLARNNRIKDYMLKSVKHLMTWCVENRIDTIVLGKNKSWKQESEMSKVNNQNFIQIPHDLLYRIIKYQSERLGIRVIEQEESYTSKASFLDDDDIPTYLKEDIYAFSGRRVKRGLYKSKTDKTINADLNGSANILRKWNKDIFKKMPDFSNVRKIKHPDLELSNVVSL